MREFLPSKRLGNILILGACLGKGQDVASRAGGALFQVLPAQFERENEAAILTPS